ncbi:MAG: hypothetical protein ABIN61_07015 [candidate division WOR-3 bacterium]
MIRLILIFILSLNPNLSDKLPGEWVGGNGFSENPAIIGNVLVNPAVADTASCISVNFSIFTDDYIDTRDGDLYSTSFVIPLHFGFYTGGSFEILYRSRLEAFTQDSEDFYYCTDYFIRKGGLSRFGIFLKKSFGLISLGTDFNLLTGKIEEKWWIDFRQYHDVYDTISIYFRGYSLGLGFNFNLENLSFGGYYSPYEEIEKESMGEKSDFELDKPLRVGFNYSFGENGNISFSFDRKESLFGFTYGFLKLGYGKIYSMGNGVSVKADRILGGLSFSEFELPVSIIFENRRYYGVFTDNEFIFSIGTFIKGKGRRDEKEF